MTELYRPTWVSLETIPRRADIRRGAPERSAICSASLSAIRANLRGGTLTGQGHKLWRFPRQKAGYGATVSATLPNMPLKEFGNTSFEGKKVIVSGSGNVACFGRREGPLLWGRYRCRHGATRAGYVYDENGLDIELIKDIKLNKRQRINVYGRKGRLWQATARAQPIFWSLPCDIALPCATQNENGQRRAPPSLLKTAAWQYLRAQTCRFPSMP